MQRAVDQAKSSYESTKNGKVREYERRLKSQNDELASLYIRRTQAAYARDQAIASKATLAETRYQEGTKDERGRGDKCAKGGFRVGDGYDNGCLSVNKNRQAALQITADTKQRLYDSLTAQIGEQEKIIRRTEQDLKDIDLEIKPLETAYKQAEAALEQGKALNNAEALKARAALAEAERKKEAEIQQKKNELEAIKAEAAKRQLQTRLKQDLIGQESQALQASADLQKSSMPMVIGFVGLVIISFIVQPMLKKKP